MDVPWFMPGERDPPEHFAGRTKELGIFRMKLDGMCEAGHTTNGLQLTVGVHGAGKSQLVRKFGDDVDGTVVHGRRVKSIYVGTDELNAPLSLFLTLCRGIDAEDEAKKIADVADKLSGLLRVSLDKKLWDGKALVVIIDELQRVDDAGMQTLCVLHDGMHRCPILLMGCGLRHTRQVLGSRPNRLRISRVGDVVELSPLSMDEAREAFEKGLEHYGYHDVPSESLQKLAAASHCFPQHIHGYLAEAALQLYASGEGAVGGDLKGSILNRALQRGQERREEYYEGLLSMGESHEPMLAVCKAMETLERDSIPYVTAKSAIEDAGGNVGDLQMAVEHGSLVHSRGNVHFGVPSFRTYMGEFLRDRDGITLPLSSTA